MRAKIDRLIQESADDDYASVSLMLGRNHAYIQQYIKRGTPRSLREEDRRLIAEHFGVSPNVLYAGTAPEEDMAPGGQRRSSTSGEDITSDLVMLSVQSRTNGTIKLSESEHSHVFQIGLSRGLLDDLTGNHKLKDFAMIEVHGDAMAPTLAQGDLMLIAIDTRSPIRDGLYALKINDQILPKRISVRPGGQRVTVNNDNALYSGWHDCAPAELDILGRIIWCGRKL